MMPLKALEKLVEHELDIWAHDVQTQFLQSSPTLVQSVYGVVAPMKQGCRLRLFTLISAKLFDLQGTLRQPFVLLISLMHLEALLHKIAVERGKIEDHLPLPTEVLILTARYTLTHIFKLLGQFNNTHLVSLFAEIAQQMSAGWLLQQTLKEIMAFDAQDCRMIAHCRGVILYELAAQSLIRLSTALSSQQALALKNFARHLGMVEQLTQDVADFTLPCTQPQGPGISLSTGRMTMPLYYTLQASTPSEVACIRSAFGHPGQAGPLLRPIHTAMVACQALEKTKAMIRHESSLALEALRELPPSHLCQALGSMVQLILAPEEA